MEIEQAIRIGIEAIRFKREHLYRAGWEISQQGGQDFFADGDARNFDRLTEALGQLEQSLLEPARMPQNEQKPGQNGDLEQGRTIDIPTGQIRAFFDPKRETWRLLVHNKWTPMVGTFYDDETRAMMKFETEDQAWQWFEDQA